MSRLATGRPPLLAGGRRRLGGLDDVGRRRLGGVGGILAGRGELPLQLGDDGSERLQLGAQGVDLRLQPLAIGTRGCNVGGHGGRVYASPDRQSTLWTVTWWPASASRRSTRCPRRVTTSPAAPRSGRAGRTSGYRT